MYLTSAQIKGKINSLAKQNGSEPIGLLRIYMMERFLERLSFSNYKDSFIIKGGILITSMIGISMRSTMDIDSTIKNFNLDKQTVYKIINEIKSNTELNNLWKKYQKKYKFASNIEYKENIETIEIIINNIK